MVLPNILQLISTKSLSLLKKRAKDTCQFCFSRQYHKLEKPNYKGRDSVTEPTTLTRTHNHFVCKRTFVWVFVYKLSDCEPQFVPVT